MLGPEHIALVALGRLHHIVLKAFWRGQQIEMSFRFRKRLRLIAGVWTNLSKRGGSLSVSRRGATMNISPVGHQESVGLPGTGLSYRTKRRKFATPGGLSNATTRPLGPRGRYIVTAIAVGAIVLWLIGHLH
jgi:uncharacterized protein DUF4236